jgi:sugar transferase (PEP-CTERM system associated)
MRVRLLGQYFQSSIVALVGLEGAAFAASLYLAALLRFGGSLASLEEESGSLWLRALVYGVATLVSFLALGLYTPRQRANAAGISLRIVLGLIASFAVVAILFYLLPDFAIGRGILGIAVCLSLLLSVLIRSVFARLVDTQTFKRQILVYGYGSRVQAFTRLRRRSDRRGYNLVGFVCPPGESLAVNPEELLSAPQGLKALCEERGIEEVVVALEDRRQNLPVRELMQCRLAGINVVDFIAFMEQETGRIYLDALNPSWLIFGHGFRRDALRRLTSRGLDFVASLVLVAVTAPILLATALLIYLEDGRQGGGVLYRQARVGLNGQLFDVLKFRSMRPDAEAAGSPQWATPNDPRVTRIGAFIRKVRIDELPQLLNVLRGDMSFVGPRPERPHFVAQLEEKIPYYAQRHSVKPGITGWAQLCYPYGASEEDAIQKLQYDLYYVKNNSLLFDLAILVQTAEVIFMGKGAR